MKTKRKEPAMSHTPGPWQATRESMGRLRIDPLQGNSRLAVADVFIPAEERAAEEGRANARLITAAPDLLAACEMLAKAHAMLPGTVSDPPARPLVALGSSELLQLLAAIAKAKGGAA